LIRVDKRRSYNQTASRRITAALLALPATAQQSDDMRSGGEKIAKAVSF
jgi:hypothetical protein